MLVLSRKKDEKIIIDENIVIEVVQIKGNTIRLGITAPRSVKILRGELDPFVVKPKGDFSIPVDAEWNPTVAQPISKAS